MISVLTRTCLYNSSSTNSNGGPAATTRKEDWNPFHDTHSSTTNSTSSSLLKDNSDGKDTVWRRSNGYNSKNPFQSTSSSSTQTPLFRATISSSKAKPLSSSPMNSNLSSSTSLTDPLPSLRTAFEQKDFQKVWDIYQSLKTNGTLNALSIIDFTTILKSLNAISSNTQVFTKLFGNKRAVVRALESVFSDMKAYGYRPGKIAYIHMLQPMARLGAIDKMEALAEEMKAGMMMGTASQSQLQNQNQNSERIGQRDLQSRLDKSVYLALLNGYAIAGDITKMEVIAAEMKNALPNNDSKDAVVYEILVEGYLNHGDFERAQTYLNEFGQQSPSLRKTNKLIMSEMKLHLLKRDYTRVFQVFESQVLSNSSSSKFRKLDSTHDDIRPSVIMFDILLDTCVQTRQFDKAMEYLHLYQLHFKSFSAEILTHLITLHGSIKGDLIGALRYFKTPTSRGSKPSSKMVLAMLNIYIDLKDASNAWKLIADCTEMYRFVSLDAYRALTRLHGPQPSLYQTFQDAYITPRVEYYDLLIRAYTMEKMNLPTSIRGLLKEAFEKFEFIPNGMMAGNVVKYFTNDNRLEEAKEVVKDLSTILMSSGSEKDRQHQQTLIYVQNALLGCASRVGDAAKFNEIRASISHPNAFTHSVSMEFMVKQYQKVVVDDNEAADALKEELKLVVKEFERLYESEQKLSSLGKKRSVQLNEGFWKWLDTAKQIIHE